MKIHMKRTMLVLSFFLVIISILNVRQVSLAAEKTEVDVIIKGKHIDVEEKPILKGDRLFVPIMYFAEGLDFGLEWLEEQNTAKLNSPENTILIAIDKKEISLNGKTITLDEKSFIANERSYVPLRSLAELLSQKVEWDQKNKTAIVGEFTCKEYVDGSLEDKYLYTNEEYGFNLKIPNHVKDKLVIKEEADGIRFYDRYNYEIEKNLGVLFTIIKTTDPEILNIVPSSVLKYEKGSYYIAHFASDVQFIVGDEKSTVEYMEMEKLSKEFLPSFKLIKDIESLAGYIRIRDNTLHFNEVEVVEREDEDRVKELGLDEYDMPSGYSIINQNKGETIFELADKVVYTFTDIYLNFVEESEGDRLYSTTKKDEFLKHLGEYDLNDIPLLEQTIPYFIEVKDGKVISITEKFKYTI